VQRTETAVRLDDIEVAFRDNTALAGFSCTVPRGSVTVLLGPNGAGKTTALRVITGALRPRAGSCSVFGLDAFTNGEEVRIRCGVVSAQPALYSRLSGRDNLLYAAELYGLDDHAPIDESAARFGIDDALELKVGGYSTGMKTRLALARAVLHDPDLLLLDEPTSGLDPESGRAVLHLIDDYGASGKTVVMCTHLLAEAEGLADQIVIMDRGQNLLEGSPEELVRRYWPHPTVLLDAEDRALLQLVHGLEGVVAVEVNGRGAEVALDDLARVPGLVAALTKSGVRLTKVLPHEVTLEELYFAVRREAGSHG
jgi:ABC-2 type transport system ATP-binding protein